MTPPNPETSAGGATITMRIPIPATLTPTPKKLLSFAEEEEEDREQAVSRIPSKLKPSSSSSHKLTSSQDKPPPTTSHSTTASNVLPRAGFYIMEALLELQRITRTLVQSSSSSELKNSMIYDSADLTQALDSSHIISNRNRIRRCYLIFRLL